MYQLNSLKYRTKLGLNIGFVLIGAIFSLTAAEHKSQCKRKYKNMKFV